MKKTKCYSVRLKSLTEISNLALRAADFSGNKCILPKSTVFGIDYDVIKSDAYWIAAWILEKKELQYSIKKEGWYNPKKGRVEPAIKVEIEHHIPKKIEPVSNNLITELKRP